MTKLTHRYIILVIVLMVSLFSCSEDDSEVQTEDQTLARISVSPVVLIEGDVASSGASIIDSGNSAITKKGICWDTSPNPDLTNFTTTDGNGSTSFTSVMENLAFNTVYYVRAYAENATGVAYSDEISFTTTNTCTLNIFDGEVRLTNQAEVDSFGANNYCGITTELIIEEAEGEQDPIVDLSPLQNIRSVFSLYINGTNSLETLEGLHNLSVVEDYLQVSDNDALQNIDALVNITSKFFLLDISRNEVLTTIDGLSGITTLIEPSYNNVTGIYIGLNPKLQHINGLSNISIEGDRGSISIHSNELLTNIDALSGISGTIENLQLVDLPNLQNTSGLSQITTVTDELSIIGLGNAASWDGLQNITSVGNKLLIADNQGLINLDMFSNLNSVTSAYFTSNYFLTDYCGLSNAVNSGNIASFTTENNAYNPSLANMQNGDCAL
ncbi:hypothetical protein G5B37_05330 [Rasiella rasia]|uniref:Fibronectin type-III domain-containing protein n=1 Tax=Rasiella rasia TaxID=2744027 RepID=A0A6G6GKR5_9FLAO|nr:hypothetical protein [Rasiella rasia]QIE59003.1 hypothetical protein G5B37_05330 [Rasiella rasia]